MHSKITKAILSAICTAVCLCSTSAIDASAAYAFGDVNGDGTINSTDSSEILRQYINISTGNGITWSAAQIKAADVNADGSIDAADASDLLGYYAYVSAGGTDTIDRYYNVDGAKAGLSLTTTAATTTAEETTVVTTTAVQIDAQQFEQVNFNVDNLYSDINVVESYNASLKHLGLRWNEIEGATGYHVEFYTDQQYDENGQPYKYEKDVSSAQFTALLPAELGANAYRYRITPYAEFEGQIKTAEKPYTSGTYEHSSIAGYSVSEEDNIKLVVNAAQLSPRDYYPVYEDYSGYAVRYDTFTVSDRAKEVIDEFAAEHFTAGMTNYDKILYFMNYIHDTVVYADGVNGRPSYSTICGYAYSEACLIHHAGQCVQYNGALDELLCYMGYNAYMIHTSRPHFRAEVEIDGYIFGMEVGETEYDSPQYGYRWFWAFNRSQAHLTLEEKANADMNAGY
ncbi:MAG: dockerin type I repeat-containing protein [Ruminococcus sp.]|nr:dockerin type I repeat-containing protein [Ruminococcus sp.]